MPTFSLHKQPEVFFSTTESSRAVRALLREGRLRKLGPRLYTQNLVDPLEAVAKRNCWRIAAGYYPGAVIADRTALEARPAKDGSLTLVANTKNERRLPGLRLRPRPGPGPVAGDQRWMGEDLYISSPPRAFLENMRHSRARTGLARTLSVSELEERLDRYVQLRPASLGELRDEARKLAPDLGAEAELARLDELIGTMTGTRDGELSSERARARRAGAPFDQRRIESFDSLYRWLASLAPPQLVANTAHEPSTFAFFESYFSNFIEGTEFALDQAERIVFDGEVPAQRPKDAHDILGTYRIITDSGERARTPADADGLIAILRSQHQVLMAARPEVGPGEFKLAPNRAGATEFVAPELVEGTLRQGFRFYASLSAGFHRAAFAMFLVSEVHPFADGNGRIARILMNSELTAAGEQRILVPIASRDDYLYALRGMTHNHNARSLTRVLATLQADSAAADFSDRDAGELWLHRRGAFQDPVREGGLDLRGGANGITEDVE